MADFLQDLDDSESDRQAEQSEDDFYAPTGDSIDALLKD